MKTENTVAKYFLNVYIVPWDAVLKLDLHFSVLANPMNSARDPVKKRNRQHKR